MAVLAVLTLAVPALGTQMPIVGVGQVLEEELPLQAQPDAGSPLLGSGHLGDWAVITGEDGGWYQVQYEGQTGYMAQEGLRLLSRENVELGYGQVTADGVHVRLGPSTQYAVTAVANQGDSCYILGVNCGWYKVLIFGQVGYLYSQYVDLTGIPYENRSCGESPQFFRGGDPLADPLAQLGGRLLQDIASGGNGSQWLRQMEELSPRRALLWQGILDHWDRVYHQMEIGGDRLPQGLPQDDSLCILVFGYALREDGSPQQELVDRLEVALTAAQQYPNAYVLCTGGGTAANSQATEAEVMARWLEDRGIDRSRILVENQSLSTIANVQRSFALLKHYPQIQQVAIVSSDYHIRRCALFFGTVSLSLSACGGRKPIAIAASAACPGTSGGGEGIYAQASGVAQLLGLSLGR